MKEALVVVMAVAFRLVKLMVWVLLEFMLLVVFMSAVVLEVASVALVVLVVFGLSWPIVRFIVIFVTLVEFDFVLLMPLMVFVLLLTRVVFVRMSPVVINPLLAFDVLVFVVNVLLVEGALWFVVWVEFACHVVDVVVVNALLFVLVVVLVPHKLAVPVTFDLVVPVKFELVV